MRILRDDQVPACDPRWVFREVGWSDLAFGLVLAAIAVALAALPLASESWGNLWITGLCALGALGFAGFARLGLRAFRASLRPTNWLLRGSPEGLTLRYRSRYNHRFPADRPTAVFLPRKEIAAVAPATTLLDAPGDHGGWTVLHRRRSLEIALRKGVDLAPLRAALAEEAALRDDRKGRFNHYPVTITRDGRLRVAMRRPEAVCRTLSGVVPVRGETRQERRFERLGATEREDHVLDLLLAGDRIGAIKAAREVYGCDLTEAKRLVDELGS